MFICLDVDFFLLRRTLSLKGTLISSLLLSTNTHRFIVERERAYSEHFSCWWSPVVALEQIIILCILQKLTEQTNLTKILKYTCHGIAIVNFLQTTLYCKINFIYYRIFFSI